jgi:hypothetical protein
MGNAARRLRRGVSRAKIHTDGAGATEGRRVSEDARGPFRAPPDEPPADAPRFGGPFIPAGMPPGTDYVAEGGRAPEVVYYFRLYAGITGVLYAILALVGIGMMLSPLWMSRPHASAGADVGAFIGGVFYAGWGIVFGAPTLIALFGGKREWVHTLGTIVIAAGMMQVCCIPILIPLLIAWLKPETRRYFDA